MSQSQKARHPALDLTPANMTHPIPVGHAVWVINLGNPPFIEGRAVISGIVRGNHRYLVSFAGDPQVRERFVHPASQEDLHDTLAWLLDLRRSSREPPSHDEFFPDHPQTKGV